MKYWIHINQVKCIEYWLNLQQWALMDLIWNTPTWATAEIIWSEVYYYLSAGKIVEEYPMISTKKDTFLRIVKKILEKELVDKVIKNNKPYYKLTEKGREFFQGVEKNPDLDRKKIQTKVGKKSTPGKEKNPDYNNTNHTNTSNTNTNNKKLDPSLDFINKKEKIKNIFELADNPEIKSKYFEFRKDRKEKNKPITSRAEALLFWKLNKIPQQISDKHKIEIAKKMFDIAIESWWSSIYYKERIWNEIIKKDTEENIKKIEAKQKAEENIDQIKSLQIKKQISQFWEKLTKQEKDQITAEAIKKAQKEKPGLEWIFLKPMIQIARKIIIQEKMNK